MTWSLEKIASVDFPVFFISVAVVPQWFHLSEKKPCLESGAVVTAIWNLSCSSYTAMLFIAAQQMRNTCNAKIYRTFLSV